MDTQELSVYMVWAQACLRQNRQGLAVICLLHDCRGQSISEYAVFTNRKEVEKPLACYKHAFAADTFYAMMNYSALCKNCRCRALSLSKPWKIKFSSSSSLSLSLSLSLSPLLSSPLLCLLDCSPFLQHNCQTIYYCKWPLFQISLNFLRCPTLSVIFFSLCTVFTPESREVWARFWIR